ncbi:DUF596 domain-containing protein [Oligella urethralis]|uniref:DUF596 domain-containing protein n=1 Tax=Oligella urethralis TaxID=90245 RepID=UPI00254EAF17|nr:DUF596 domain-containing protein [Oligella urethralis]MDK6203688.1 DUF596 domain-containing protein [Oligella urethralis]
MKIIEIDDEIYERTIEEIEGFAADALWLTTKRHYKELTYEERKQFFLSVMYRLMKEGRLKLAFQGKFLEGTIEEQVALYSERWPKNEAELDEADFQFITNPENENQLLLWPLCGFVWFYEDGFIEWT